MYSSINLRSGNGVRADSDLLCDILASKMRLRESLSLVLDKPGKKRISVEALLVFQKQGHLPPETISKKRVRLHSLSFR